MNYTEEKSRKRRRIIVESESDFIAKISQGILVTLFAILFCLFIGLFICLLVLISHELYGLLILPVSTRKIIRLIWLSFAVYPCYFYIRSIFQG